MFGSIGMTELLVIFVIALIIFGPRKLPELGRSLGRSLGEFRRASNDLRNTLEEEIRIEEHKPAAPYAAPVPAVAAPASVPVPVDDLPEPDVAQAASPADADSAPPTAARTADGTAPQA